MRFWLGKLMGFLLGLLFGIGIVLVPAVVDRLLHPSYWAIDAHALGLRGGFIYSLLPTTAISLLIGLLFGIIGQAWGGRLQKAANQRSTQCIAAMQAEQAESVWPPPITGDTDDTEINHGN